MKRNYEKTDAWYTVDGPDSDVTLSSRVRFARNLDGFIFPLKIKSDDAERVQSIILDAFNHLESPEHYQTVRMSSIDALGRRILSERGILHSDSGSEPWRAVILRNDGLASVTVNMDDHLRISSFSSGLSLDASGHLAREITDSLSTRIRYACDPDFGYLSTSPFDCGTGMKASILVCLPALHLNGLLDRVIRESLAQGLSVRGFYGQKDGSSLGSLYQISTLASTSGTEESQIQLLQEACEKIITLERRSRKELMEKRPTFCEDIVFRAITTAKYARFISFTEAVELLERLRFGLSANMISGIGNLEINALLYRIQNAHMSFLIQGSDVTIEEDVTSEEERMDRMRTMVIQEVLKKADIRERRN